jgi:hypothetical protein
MNFTVFHIILFPDFLSFLSAFSFFLNILSIFCFNFFLHEVWFKVHANPGITSGNPIHVVSGWGG